MKPDLAKFYIDPDCSKFLDLVQKGDIEAVRTFQSQHLDDFDEIINIRNSLKKTALILAVENDHIELAEWLIDQGIDVDSQDESKNSASTFAIIKGHTTLVEKITARANAYYISSDISDALEMNKDEMADLIIKQVIETRKDIWPEIAKTIFFNTDAELNYLKLSEISKKSVDSSIAENAGSFLRIYADLNNLEQVQKILKINGHCINDVDEYNYTALSYAALRDHSEIVKFLINSGADADIITNYSQSALSLAVENNHKNNIATLLPKTNLENVQDALYIFHAYNNSSAIETLLNVADDQNSAIFLDIVSYLHEIGYITESPSISPSPDAVAEQLASSQTNLNI
ncbi:MAG: ankyrin repeat domain-containing protein [Pseudomonadota bacterium]